MPHLSIIIPVYNEEGNLRALAEELNSTVLKADFTCEIIFVNDASTDSSAEILNNLSAANPRLRVIHLEENRGQSFAMHTGIQAAGGTYLAFLDADLQNNPADLLSMYPLVTASDVVLGYRGKRQDNLWKKTTSEIGNILIRLLFGVSVIDSGCTLRIGKAGVFQQLPYFKNYHRYFNLMIQKQGWRVVDFETKHRSRATGSSKYSWFKVFGVLAELARLKYRL